MLVLTFLLAAPLFGVLFSRTSSRSEKADISEKHLRGSREALLEVGRQLAGDGELFVSREEPSPALPVLLNSAKEDFPLRRMVALNLVGFKIPVAAEMTSLEAEPAAAVSSQAAVAIARENAAREDEAEAFMARQAVFGGYAIPASVDCGAPALPFEYIAPVSAEVTSLFGYRVHPIYGDVRFHYGTDFNVADGDDIYAFAQGTVKTAGTIAGYGLTLVIDHGDGFESLYGHCSELLASEGEAVAAGQLVALVGHSGQVTGPHLHFELKKDGLYLNPEFYL